MGKEIAAKRFDLGDQTLIQQVADWMGPLLAKRRGKVRIVLETAAESVTEYQQKYFHGHVVATLADFLEENHQPIPDGLSSYHEYAQEYLRMKCLSVPVFNRSGHLKGHVTRSTTALTVDEMWDYIQRCRTYLGDKLRLTTYDPDRDWRVNQPQRNRKVPA